MENNGVTESVKKAMLCMTRQCWEQGIVAQALLETKDMECLNIVVHDMVLRQSEDGRLCNVENTQAVTDAAFCIHSTLAVARLKDNQYYLEAVEKNIRYLLKHAPRNSRGVIYHMQETREIWADSAGFTPSAFALTGHCMEGFEQMEGLRELLYDPDKKLYYHIYDETKGYFKRKVHWGVGNGWFLTGFLRLYLALPGEYAWEKEQVLSWLRELVDTMFLYQSPNGLFYDNMIDETTFEETEVAEMLAYVIYRSVKEGILKEQYFEKAEQIRCAVLKKVSKEGTILDCASSPDFLSPGTSPEGQAHFLMMEYAREQIN